MGTKIRSKQVLFLFTAFTFSTSAQPSNVLISSEQSSRFDNQHNNKCEPISIPLCQELKNMYNQTIFPNLLGHTKQDEGISDGI